MIFFSMLIVLEMCLQEISNFNWKKKIRYKPIEFARIHSLFCFVFCVMKTKLLQSRKNFPAATYETMILNLFSFLQVKTKLGAS